MESDTDDLLKMNYCPNCLNKKLSEWLTVEGYCATRVIDGTDPNNIKNRITFIEKSGRIRIKEYTNINDGHLNWKFICSGSSDYGLDYDTRQTIDYELIKLGYKLNK